MKKTFIYEARLRFLNMKINKMNTLLYILLKSKKARGSKLAFHTEKRLIRLRDELNETCKTIIINEADKANFCRIIRLEEYKKGA